MAATVLRDGIVRLDGLPLVINVAGLPPLARGARVSLQVRAIDLWQLSAEAGFAGVIEAVPEQALAEPEEAADLTENSD